MYIYIILLNNVFFIKIVFNSISLYISNIRIYNISYCDKTIIYYVTFLYRYSIVEDDEANVAYSRSIDEGPTALRPLLVVGQAQNVAWLNVLAVLVFPSSAPYYNPFLEKQLMVLLNILLFK